MMERQGRDEIREKGGEEERERKRKEMENPGSVKVKVKSINKTQTCQSVHLF